MEQLSFDDLLRACSRCGETKPLTTGFPRNGKRYHVQCHTCKAEIARQWRQDDPERAKATNRAKYQRLRADPIRLARKQELRMAGYRRQKAAVFAHYGQACACCGSAENLQIDHVNGGGSAHRRKVGSDWYRWLIRNNFPDGFQVLCLRCNLSKFMGPKCVLEHD